LSSTAATTYAGKKADKLIADKIIKPEERDAFIQQYLRDVFLNAADLQNYLKGERSSTNREAIKASLSAYYESLGNTVDDANSLAESTLATLEAGGQAAVDAYKKLHPEATFEELNQIFHTYASSLSSAMDDASKLTVGSYVDTNTELGKVLVSLGAVDNNGVVTSAFNLYDTYKELYNLMQNKANATIGELNAAFLLMAQEKFAPATSL